MALRDIDRGAVLVGAVTALAILAPPVLIVRALKPSDLPYQESNLWVVAAAAFLVSFPIGGYVAARRQPERAYGAGALAAALAYVVVIVVSMLRRLASGTLRGEFFTTAGLLATIAISLGIVGGHVASRRAARDLKVDGEDAAAP